MSDIRFNRWLHQSGTGGVYQDSSGNIGIGTSVPTSALDVQNGTIKIGSNTLSSSGVSTFSNGIVSGVSTLSTLNVGTGGTVITTISSGLVGIGTTNPSRIIDVRASSSQNAAYILKNTGVTTTGANSALSLSAQTTSTMSSGYGPALAFEHRDSSGGYAGSLISSLANADPFGADLVLSSRYYGYVEGLRITSGGNVGINSTIPAAKLDIIGGSSKQLQITGTEADIWLKSTGPGTTWRILGSTGGGTHRFRVYDETNSLERFGIDSSGRVQMPYQPYARASSTSLTSATNAIPLNGYNLNRGGITISGNRFTVPVAGAYVFGYHHLGNNGSGACQVEIRHNGTYVSGTRTQDTNSSNDSFGTQTVKELAASDYIEFWVIQGTTHNNQDYNSMWIWLIG